VLNVKEASPLTQELKIERSGESSTPRFSFFEPGPVGPDALTFDDVLVLPGYSEVLPADVDTRVALHPRLHLNVPIVSAAMDTITEAPMAIALARQGGLGIIHRNLSPEDQAEEVDKVKRSTAGMIVNPITLTADRQLKDAEAIMSRYHISGVPITEEEHGGRLVGILTNRDIRFATDFSRPIRDYMTSKNLVTAPIGTTLEQAKLILHEHRIEKLPLVDENYHLKGLITYKDILKREDFPNATADAQGRLLVAAAIGVGDKGLRRAERLVRAEVDALAIDTAHGHSRNVLTTIRECKKRWPDMPILAGNVVTAEGTLALIDAGADVVKVGVGAGSICTTRVVAGVGMPQISAVAECARAGASRAIPVIADGGIRYSGDVVKALAAGASAVMLGSLLAGLEEAPGELIIREGRRFKEYRGMGSVGAMRGRASDRYMSAQSTEATPTDAGDKVVPEGIEGQVAYKGRLADYLFQVVGGLRNGMGYVGAANLDELRHKARFIRISQAGYVESHPHSVFITKEAPNYQALPR
jgi:IMP dehydrogenase